MPLLVDCPRPRNPHQEQQPKPPRPPRVRAILGREVVNWRRWRVGHRLGARLQGGFSPTWGVRILAHAPRSARFRNRCPVGHQSVVHCPTSPAPKLSTWQAALAVFPPDEPSLPYVP